MEKKPGVDHAQIDRFDRRGRHQGSDTDQDRTSLGRRPYNDVVIDNPFAISGEHAAVHLHGEEVEIEDLGNTNGTFLNGQPIKRQRHKR